MLATATEPVKLTFRMIVDATGAWNT